MEVFLSFVGVLFSLGSAISVLDTYIKWKGFARGGILLLVISFFSFSAGFAVRIFSPVPNFDSIFFSFGSAVLLFGIKKIFSYEGTV